MKILSLSTHYYQTEPLSRRLLMKLQNSTFKTVELFLTPGHIDYRSTDQAMILRREMAEFNLEVASVHAPYDPNSKANIASLSREERDTALGDVFTAIRFLKAVGGKYLVLHPGSADFDPSRIEEHLEISAVSIQKIIEFASAAGMQVALENPPLSDGELASEKETWFKLINLVNDSRLKLCFDTGHGALINLSLHDIEAEFPGRLLAVHLSDNDGKSDLHWVPGEGVFDWDGMSRDLSGISSHRDIFLTLEIGHKACPEERLPHIRLWLEKQFSIV